MDGLTDSEMSSLKISVLGLRGTTVVAMILWMNLHQLIYMVHQHRPFTKRNTILWLGGHPTLVGGRSCCTYQARDRAEASRRTAICSERYRLGWPSWVREPGWLQKVTAKYPHRWHRVLHQNHIPIFLRNCLRWSPSHLQSH